MGANTAVMARVNTKRGLLSVGNLDEEENIKDVKNVALVAHNNMKPTMRNFVKKFKDVLVNYTLVGTQTTLTMVHEEMKEYGDKLKLGAACLSGPFGGDAQLAAEIAAGRIGCLIFFVDPLSAHPHNADVQCLLRLARVHEILLATNEMTAYCIVEALRASLTGIAEAMNSETVKMTESAAVYRAENAKKLKSLDPAAKKNAKQPSIDETVGSKGRKESFEPYLISRRPADDSDVEPDQSINAL